MSSSPDNDFISVVVPLYNEEEVLHEFHRRLTAVLDKASTNSEIIYVNDGSTDGSLALITQLRQQDDRIAILDLSRNFGKEIAMTAGLHNANGNAVIIIDADLQDPPELIPRLIEEWKNGFDVVYAKRSRREGESLLKTSTAHLFYRLMQYIGRVKIPEDTGDFRLLNRRAVNALNQLNEQHRFMKGLFAWIGFKQKAVLYERDPRHAGTTKWNYRALWGLAIEGVTSFTIAPLKISTYIGLITAIGAFMYGIYILISTLLFGNPVPGYPSLVVIILFLGGVQLTAIGIMGEYLGRIFSETKQRPLYFTNEYLPRRMDTSSNNRSTDDSAGTTR